MGRAPGGQGTGKQAGCRVGRSGLAKLRGRPRVGARLGRLVEGAELWRGANRGEAVVYSRLRLGLRVVVGSGRGRGWIVDAPCSGRKERLGAEPSCGPLGRGFVQERVRSLLRAALGDYRRKPPKRGALAKRGAGGLAPAKGKRALPGRACPGGLTGRPGCRNLLVYRSKWETEG